MKHQVLFSSKDNSEKIKVSSAAIFVWRLRVNPTALRKAKIAYSFSLSECSRVEK